MDAPALSKEEVATLVADLRINRPGAKDKLILGHVRLGRSIVRRIASRVGDFEELTSVMMLALVEAVDKFIVTSYDDNITGYVVDSIHHAISCSLRDRQLVTIPEATNRMRRNRGQEEISIPQVIEIHEADVLRYDSNLQQLEVNEMAEKVCVSDNERKVISLRLKGHNDSEIGEALGLSRWVVWSIRQGIQERYRHEFS